MTAMRRTWTYGQWVALALAGILLGGCGGGGDSGGFTSTGVPPPQPIRVTITADRTSLPANVITDPAAAALSAPTIVAARWNT